MAALLSPAKFTPDGADEELAHLRSGRFSIPELASDFASRLRRTVDLTAEDPLTPAKSDLVDTSALGKRPALDALLAQIAADCSSPAGTQAACSMFASSQKHAATFQPQVVQGWGKFRG